MMLGLGVALNALQRVLGGGGGGGGGDWLLATGIWSSAGIWTNDGIWKASP